jgi:hypothetical protein
MPRKQACLAVLLILAALASARPQPGASEDEQAAWRVVADAKRANGYKNIKPLIGEHDQGDRAGGRRAQRPGTSRMHVIALMHAGRHLPSPTRGKPPRALPMPAANLLTQTTSCRHHGAALQRVPRQELHCRWAALVNSIIRLALPR